MEYKFKTETILDFPVYQDFQRTYAHANRMTITARLVLVPASIYYICNFDNPILLFGFLIVAAVMLITYLIQNRKGGNTQYKRMLVSNNGLPHHSVCEFQDTQILDKNLDSGNTYTYGYDRVKYLIDGPNLILVVLDYRLCVILQKKGVSGGTPEELVTFLLEHCPNIKKKKARGTAFGKWITRMMYIILVVGSIFALMNIPGFSLMDKVSGKLTNDMSYQQMAGELKQLDIAISQQTLDELAAYDAEYLAEWDVDYYRDNRNASKVQDLLYWEGCGQYDQDTWEWTPSSSGIYWMDMEVWNVDSIYTDFLNGLDAMSDAITVSDIREDYSDADFENGTGTVSFSFDLNGTRHSLDAWYNFDWFDMEVISSVGGILEADDDPRDLYVSDDGGQGLYFYYGRQEAAKQLSRLTGLTFLKAGQVYSLY